LAKAFAKNDATANPVAIVIKLQPEFQRQDARSGENLSEYSASFGV
jgi:hypothetical protein